MRSEEQKEFVHYPEHSNRSRVIWQWGTVKTRLKLSSNKANGSSQRLCWAQQYSDQSHITALPKDIGEERKEGQENPSLTVPQ